MIKIAGVDEAGRGSLAGSVVAAAVVFSKGQNKQIYFDSKKLTPTRREELFTIILSESLAVGIGVASNVIVDEINVLQATFVAMRKALNRCRITPDIVLVDGNKTIPDILTGQKAVVKGDEKVPVISAASIIAKVVRDRIMLGYDKVYPQYFFSRHKGYGTKLHKSCIKNKGISPIHRISFRHK